MYIDEALFREIFHKFVFIECEEALEGLLDTIELFDGANGVLAYCFCEDLAGLSFNLLAAARKDENGRLTIGKVNNEDFARVRFKDVRDYEFELADNLEADLSQFLELPETILKNFESADEKITMLRELELLDASRNLEFPDFVSVTVAKKGYLPEVVWVRTTGFGEDVFYGTLLNPPTQVLGLKPNQEVSYHAYDNNGAITLVLDMKKED